MLLSSEPARRLSPLIRLSLPAGRAPGTDGRPAPTPDAITVQLAARRVRRVRAASAADSAPPRLSYCVLRKRQSVWTRCTAVAPRPPFTATNLLWPSWLVAAGVPAPAQLQRRASGEPAAPLSAVSPRARAAQMLSDGFIAPAPCLPSRGVLS